MKCVTNIFVIGKDLHASAGCVDDVEINISVCSKGKRLRVVQRTVAGYGVTNAGEVGNTSD